eukprot:tig00001085_g6968.t1
MAFAVFFGSTSQRRGGLRTTFARPDACTASSSEAFGRRRIARTSAPTATRRFEWSAVCSAEEAAFELRDPFEAAAAGGESLIYPGNTVRQHIMLWSSRDASGRPVKPAHEKVVYLVRHGQSSWNKLNKIQGRSDHSVLTDKGRLQAMLVGEAIREIDFDVVFCSPLQRARQTAEAALARHTLWASEEKAARSRHALATSNLGEGPFLCGAFAMQLSGELREIDLREWEGLTKEEVKQRSPELYGQWSRDPVALSLGGRRPVVDMWHQALRAWNQILATDARTVLVVAHNAVNKAMVSTALGVGPNGYRQLLQGNGGISVVRFGATGLVEVETVNQTHHMKASLPEEALSLLRPEQDGQLTSTDGL